MSTHDPKDPQRDAQHEGQDHWNELDAVRRFPSEDEWLDLPMPGDDELRSSELDGDDGSSFADRVLQAHQEERQLDEQIAELDRALPNEVLQQFRAPEPSASFLDDTNRRVHDDRRQRWAETLSRYVAPEPSPEFVNRTLAALQDAAQQDGPQQDGPQQGRQQQDGPQKGAQRLRTQQKGPTRRGATTRRSRQTRQLTHEAPRSRNVLPIWGLLSAAAAAMLWLLLSDRSLEPLELRIANQAPISVSYVDSTTPMAAILSHVADDEEPHALFDEPADGLWLAGESGELR